MRTCKSACIMYTVLSNHGPTNTIDSSLIVLMLNDFHRTSTFSVWLAALTGSPADPRLCWQAASESLERCSRHVRNSPSSKEDSLKRSETHGE